MDILVLDAPMKFIHGKMVEQGAKEWSRYLTKLFNPIGRGVLYSESFDKEQGLKVYLYSALITLECVGENKGYLKVVKAQDTDVLAYHKAIEEGKLIEENITFVPIYKFQYINGKEHHDVEHFMQLEKEKRSFENYVQLWEKFMLDGQSDQSKLQLEEKNAQVEQALKQLYEGKTAHPDMRAFLPTTEKVKPMVVKEFMIDDFTMHYDRLTDEQKQMLEFALSTEDLYFIGTQSAAQSSNLEALNHAQMAILRELIQQIARKQKVLFVAPDTETVQKILEQLDKECLVEVAHLQSLKENEAFSPFTLECQIQSMRNRVLRRLNEEVSKQDAQKEELDAMKAECDIYQSADKVIAFCFEILETLKVIESEKAEAEEESKALGLQGQSYAEALDKYEAISESEHEAYSKLKEELRKSDHLYDEILWMRSYENVVDYEGYKKLILAYSKEVRTFEEKVSAYKAQVNQRKQCEEEYKALEVKLLEKRRQYLKTEAMRQIDYNGQIKEDENVSKEIQELELQIAALRYKNEQMAAGVSNTRYLDELKVKVYELKAKVDEYMNRYQEALMMATQKEVITKADVLDVFERMYKVESIISAEDYVEYIEGIEEYLELEVIDQKNKQLIKMQETNHKKMTHLLQKEQEVMALLASKLMEKSFTDFIGLVEEGTTWVAYIMQNPLETQSAEYLNKLQEVIQKHAFKLEIYKEKVALYKEIEKLKLEWKTTVEEDNQLFADYVLEKINVVGTTCYDLMNESNDVLLKEPFDYVIIHQADKLPHLEAIVPMIRGKRVILIGELTNEKKSLFAKLYERCPEDHKSLLA